MIDYSAQQSYLNSTFHEMMDETIVHLNSTWRASLRMANGQIRNDFLRATKTASDHESTLTQKENEIERLRNEYLVRITNL